VKDDLLVPSSRGEYVLTEAGRRAELALSTFVDVAAAREAAATIVLVAFADETVRETIEKALPGERSLSAVLQSQIQGRGLQPAGTLTVHRSAPAR
jgi:hypothetical protein